MSLLGLEPRCWLFQAQTRAALAERDAAVAEHDDILSKLLQAEHKREDAVNRAAAAEQQREDAAKKAAAAEAESQ